MSWRLYFEDEIGFIKMLLSIMQVHLNITYCIANVYFIFDCFQETLLLNIL